ncbi:MAG: tRNA-(ms[2]io[6]A)-hydroxylase [Pseudomonadales bacterium]
MARPDKQPVLDFLTAPTPSAWFDAAAGNLPTLLIDHANCEKKAASSAMALMYRYVNHPELLRLMSRLAREELRHFEQVLDLMEAQGVCYTHINSSRYAGELHQLVRKEEPHRLVDQLILGAVVEARSCERFIGLAEVLPASVAQLYTQLVDSEARHFQDYLRLAERQQVTDLADRVALFLERDAELITSADRELRFHSGVPG